MNLPSGTIDSTQISTFKRNWWAQFFLLWAHVNTKILLNWVNTIYSNTNLWRQAIQKKIGRKKYKYKYHHNIRNEKLVKNKNTGQHPKKLTTQQKQLRNSLHFLKQISPHFSWQNTLLNPLISPKPFGIFLQKTHKNSSAFPSSRTFVVGQNEETKTPALSGDRTTPNAPYIKKTFPTSMHLQPNVQQICAPLVRVTGPTTFPSTTTSFCGEVHFVNLSGMVAR